MPPPTLRSQSIFRKPAVGVLLAVLVCLPPAHALAQTAVQAWVQCYNQTGFGFDVANAVAVDASNNVIVTGYSYGIGTFVDYATIKYSAAGVPLWTNRYNGPTNYDYATALVLDASNNVIVTGYSAGVGSGYDYATIQYSAAGAPLWTNRYNGPGHGSDKPSAIMADGRNDVIVTGSSSNGTNDDYATVKYSSAGSPLWTNRYDGPGNGADSPSAVAVDGSNDVVVTGYSFNGTNDDYLTIKYSSAGVPLWTNRYNGPGNDIDVATALAVDASNNVIVTGYSFNGTNNEYATIQYSSAGVPLWTNRYHGPGTNDDAANAVAVDTDNNVIVTGFSSGTGSSSDFDYATVKYSSAGVPLWTNRYNTPLNSDDEATALAVDASNNVVVTGFSDGGGNSYDYVTIEYSSASVPLWTNRYDGPVHSGDYAQAVAVDHSGNAIVTGYSTSSSDGFDFATIKYLSFLPTPVLTVLPPAAGAFQLRVDNLLQPGTLVIEASTNLSAWGPVFTNTTSTNVLFYSDPGMRSLSWRFYRALQFP